MTGIAPTRHELAWRNRRLLADRLHWPLGAVQTCEWTEIEHPDWSPSWQKANAWARTPAGYYATHRDRRVWTGSRWRHPEVYGATQDELVAAIKAEPKEN